MNKLFEINNEFGTGTVREYNLSKHFEDNILLKQYYPYQFNSWKDHKKYGILNSSGLTIYPKQESLKDYISDSGYGNRNINFVADAFLDLKKSMQSLYSKSIID